MHPTSFCIRAKPNRISGRQGDALIFRGSSSFNSIRTAPSDLHADVDIPYRYDLLSTCFVPRCLEAVSIRSKFWKFGAVPL